MPELDMPLLQAAALARDAFRKMRDAVDNHRAAIVTRRPTEIGTANQVLTTARKRYETALADLRSAIEDVT